MIISTIQTRISLFQSTLHGESALPINAKRDEGASLRIGDRVIFRTRVAPLRDATPILAPTHANIGVLQHDVAWCGMTLKLGSNRKEVDHEPLLTYFANSCGKDTLTSVPRDIEVEAPLIY